MGVQAVTFEDLRVLHNRTVSRAEFLAGNLLILKPGERMLFEEHLKQPLTLYKHARGSTIPHTEELHVLEEYDGQRALCAPGAHTAGVAGHRAHALEGLAVKLCSLLERERLAVDRRQRVAIEVTRTGGGDYIVARIIRQQRNARRHP